MAELAKHGGKRVGSGRPTAHAQKAKQDAAKAAVSAREAKRQAALAAAWEQVETAAEGGERWAVEMLIEHEVGRPGTKVQHVEDTEITLITRFPRGAFACPHCGKEISEFNPLGANLGLKDSISGEQPLEPIWREGEGRVGREAPEADDLGGDTGADDEGAEPG